MKIMFVGETNLFLFQNVVYYLIKILKHKWYFPIESKYSNKNYKKPISSLYYIYDSWLNVLIEKFSKFELNEYGKRLIKQETPWMVTTNIAITKSQVARNRFGIPKWALENAQKYKPYFLIEFDLASDTYIAHLDDEIENIFNEGLFLRDSLNILNKEGFITLLKRYFVFDEETISKEVEVIVQHYVYKESGWFSFKDYEELEERNK